MYNFNPITCEAEVGYLASQLHCEALFQTNKQTNLCTELEHVQALFFIFWLFSLSNIAKQLFTLY